MAGAGASGGNDSIGANAGTGGGPAAPQPSVVDMVSSACRSLQTRLKEPYRAEMPAIEFFLRHKLAPAIDNAVARSAPSERRVWSVVLTLARESLVTDKREDVAEASDTGTEAAVTQRQDSSGGAGSASTTQTGESSASDSVGAGNATSVAAVGKVEAIDRAVIDTAASKGRDLVVMVSAMIAGVEHNPGSLQRLLWGERRVANLFEGMEAGTARPQTTVTVSGVDSIPTYGSLWKRSREDSHSHSDEPSATRRRIQLLSYAPDGVLTVDEGSVIPPEAVGAAPAGEAAATSPEFEPAAESGSVEEGGAGITTDAGAAIARTVVLHEYLSKRDSLHRVFGTASLAAWAAAEDKQLLEALMSSGKRINWAPISAKLGRSVPACRKRAQELEGERPGR